MMAWLFFLLCSCGAEIFWKSFRKSLEPVGSEIFPAQRAWDYKKILNGFLPIRAQKRFVLLDWFVFVHFCPELPEFSDYGEIRIQETMCFITWITINAHKCFINLFSIIFYDNSLQDLHEVPEHLWSARKRHRSALCDALPDKEVPSAWSISGNSW